MGVRKEQKYTVALAGNPNVGKSTLFNVLTGMRQHTGNWAGKTVELAQGIMRLESSITVVDLPGTYSLEGKSIDERLAARFIDAGHADCVVVVCDGCALERNLILALQILNRAEKVILCVNLMDEAQSRGFRIDGERLEKLLKIPVVFTSAGRKRGIHDLVNQIRSVASKEASDRSGWVDPVTAAKEIAEKCVQRDAQRNDGWRCLLDRVLVSRRYGMPLLMLMLLFIIWLTVWGANFPSQLLERLFDGGYAVLHRASVALPWWMSGVLIDGMYMTCARVIAVMLPPMAIFFILFTILEDVGYLPRMAFLLDRGMCRCGGCGKQALTLCMGLGCNAVGVTGCRIIDSPRERLAAILTNAMVPCNGRFPALIFLGGLFFTNAGGALAVSLCVVLGVAGAMAATSVMSRTVLKHESSCFVMELPPFRRPRIGQILIRSLLDRTIFVAGRALSVAAPAGAALWIVANTPVMGWLIGLLDPVGQAMGMNGAILLAFILSLPANELLIPVLLMAMYGVADLGAASSLSGQLLVDGGMTWQMAVCTMVFTVFHWPCATTLLTVYKETQSNTKTAAAFIMPTAVGALLCVILNGIFSIL